MKTIFTCFLILVSGLCVVQAQTIPAPPARASLVAAGFNSISLSWPAVAGATFYRIQISKSPDPSAPSPFPTLTAGESFLTIENLEPNTAYYVTVQAGGPHGNSSPSPVAAVHTLFDMTDVFVWSSTHTRFEWEVVEGATSYLVSVLNSDPVKPDLSIRVTSTNFIISGLGVANRYTVQITALDNNNSVIAHSESINFQTLPEAPVNLVVSVEPTSMVIQWSAAEGAAFYHVQVIPSNSPSPVYDTTTPSAGTIVVPGLTPGALYLVSVVSLSGPPGNNPVSNSSPIYVVIMPGVPSAVQQDLLFPNPAKDDLTIALPNATESSITIRDLTNTARFQSTHRQSTVKVDLTGLSAGLYIVEIVQGKLRRTSRLQVEK